MKKSLMIGLLGLVGLLATSCSYRGNVSTATPPTSSDSTTEEPDTPTGENTFSSDITESEKKFLAQVASGSFTKVADYKQGQFDAKFEVKSGSPLTAVVYRTHLEKSGMVAYNFNLYIAVSSKDFTILNYAFDTDAEGAQLTSHHMDDAFANDALKIIGTTGEGTVVADATVTSNAIIDACKAASEQARSEIAGEVDTNTYSEDITDAEKEFLAQVASGKAISKVDFTATDLLNVKYEVKTGEELTSVIYVGHDSFTEQADDVKIDMEYDLYVNVSLEDYTILDYAWDGKIASREDTLNNFINDGLHLIGSDGDVDVIASSTHTSQSLIKLCKAAVSQAKADYPEVPDYLLKLNATSHTFTNTRPADATSSGRAEGFLLIASIVDAEGAAYAGSDLADLKQDVTYKISNNNLLTVTHNSTSLEANQVGFWVYATALAGEASVTIRLNEASATFNTTTINDYDFADVEITDAAIADFDSFEKNTFYRITGTIEMFNWTNSVELTDGEGNTITVALAPEFAEDLFTQPAGDIMFTNPDTFDAFAEEKGLKVGDELTVVGIKDWSSFKGYLENYQSK